MVVAAIVGNAVNYMVGRRVAHLFRLDAPETSMHRWVKREYVQRAHEFFEQHGGRAVVLARFVPIVRTFLPFVAGGAGMTYRSFTFYNVTGCLLWVGTCVGAGLPVRQHPGREEQLHTRGARHRRRVAPADGVRADQSAPRRRLGAVRLIPSQGALAPSARIDGAGEAILHA